MESDLAEDLIKRAIQELCWFKLPCWFLLSVFCFGRMRIDDLDVAGPGSDLKLQISR
jgi:hypothetical protein